MIWCKSIHGSADASDSEARSVSVSGPEAVSSDIRLEGDGNKCWSSIPSSNARVTFVRAMVL